MKNISFAIIGGGPSAFYTAKLLSKLLCNPTIHIIEKQLCPFGLIRWGVAPDHIPIKRIQLNLSEVMKNPNVHYIGNKYINNEDMKKISEIYSGVVYAYGASSNMGLDLSTKLQNKPGNIVMARDIVYWYNNHPEFERSLPFHQKANAVKNVVIIGNGNVAIDIARIFLRNPKQLSNTQISKYALEYLKSSKIKNVQIIGRRGVTHASYALKQIRQLHKLGIKLYAIQQELEDSLNESSQYEYSALADHLASIVRMNKRKINFMKQSFNIVPQAQIHSILANQEQKVIFQYLLSPSSINPQSSQLTCNRNQLIGEPFKQKAIKTDSQVTIQYDLLVQSIGFKVQQLSNSLEITQKSEQKSDGGLILNSNKNSVDNSNGCVIKNQKIAIGQYTVGWCKNGAKGVIDQTYLGCQQTFNNIRIHIQNQLLQQKQIFSPKELGSSDLYKNTYSFNQYLQVRHQQFKDGNQQKWIRTKLNSSQIKKIYGID